MLQNLFPINDNSSQRKPKLISTLCTYSSIRFVFETVFISEEIEKECFGGMLEIIIKFISKVASYVILQLSLENFKTILINRNIYNLTSVNCLYGDFSIKYI